MTVILKDIKLAHCLTPHSVVGKKNVDPLVVEVQRLKKEIEILKIDHAAEIKKLEENLLHEKENIAHGKENIASAKKIKAHFMVVKEKFESQSHSA